MVTTSSNPLVSKVHGRMPVILRKPDERKYLESDPDEAKALLQPYPEHKMELYEVSRKVNSSKGDSPDLVDPKQSKGTLLEFMR